MKKIITLMVCAGAFLSAFAQSPAEESRRVILGRRTNTGSGSENTSNDPRDILGRRTGSNSGNQTGTYGTREQQIDQVNRDYDAKIYSVRNNSNLSQAEKDRIIRQLNADRARRIREINNQYGSDRRDGDRRYGDRDRRDDDRRDRRYDRRDRDDDDDDDYRKEKKVKSNNGNHYGWEKGKGNPHKNGGHPAKGKSKNKGH